MPDQEMIERWAAKIAPDLARGMKTYNEYVTRGEVIGTLARGYKRKWDELLGFLAAYREEIEAAARADIERLREALERVIDHAEDWHEHYCEMWGDRRKEQQNAIFGDILNARAILARESAEPAEERGPEVDALIWMAEHVMGAGAAEAMRGWLARFRAEGRLVVRDAAGLEIAHYPEEGDR